jgi:hypothetical protein
MFICKNVRRYAVSTPQYRGHPAFTPHAAHARLQVSETDRQILLFVAVERDTIAAFPVPGAFGVRAWTFVLGLLAFHGDRM